MTSNRSNRLSLQAVLPMLMLTVSVDRLAAQCGNAWLPGDGIRSINGTAHAMLPWDPDGAGPSPEVLVVGGTFGWAGSASARSIATYDPNAAAWASLGSGLTGTGSWTGVRAITTTVSGELVAAGAFTTSGGTGVNCIARWNGNAWLPLGTGVGGGVSDTRINAAVRLTNGDLVVGGDFTLAGGNAANFVARWDGAAWYPLGSGLDGTVHALAVLANGDLIAGGEFTLAATANYVARWDGSAWTALGAGTDDFVMSLAALPNGDVIAGGYFQNVGSIAAPYIARWSGGAWTSMGAADGLVNAMDVSSTGQLLAGGEFTVIGGVSASEIAAWNGSTWSALGAGIAPDVMCVVARSNGDVYVGGGLVSAGGQPVENCARWSNGVWSGLDSTTFTDQGISAAARCPNGDLVVGGFFTHIGSINANRVARWDGSSWSAMGSGMDGPVEALTVLPNGDVIASGDFTVAGGSSATRIARWNGVSWVAMGSGMDGSVVALATMSNGDVVAGGWFGTAGGVVAPYLARWNGTTWSAFGGGMDGPVLSLLTTANGHLVAGGGFWFAGSVLAPYIAQWNGVNWAAFSYASGGPAYANVLAMRPDGTLVVGAQLGGVHNVGYWNGSAWVVLGSGMDGPIMDLIVLPGGDLIAAGGFAHADGVPTNGIARWNGQSWAPIGSGLEDGWGNYSAAYCLTSLGNGDLFVGGEFLTAGGQPAAYHAHLTTSCPATATATGTGCTGSGGPNVLTAMTLPWIGSTFHTRATGMPALAFVLAVTGFSTTFLPLAALLPQGGPGCSLLAAPDVVDLLLPVSGVATAQLALPNTAALVGLQFHQQMLPLEVDPLLNITAFTSTNAVTATIGAF